MADNTIKKEICRQINTGELSRNATLKEALKSVTETVRQMDITELRKTNATATKLRLAGNQLYKDQKYDEALICYNESICYAEPGSDQLAMGYANRSAVYFKQEEYEFALYNIDLAKKYSYPEPLMPKLVDRELNCKQQIILGHSKGTVPRSRMNMNVDINPRIPFLADGIGMNYDPKFGRGLVTEKEFTPGDVILDEKIELCAVDIALSYHNCNHCSSQFKYSLIPCPTCPLMMYCSHECLEMSWKFYHRFECGVVTKLNSASFLWTMIILRLFFYGLSQFDDDLQAMMDYCEREVKGRFNPLDLDYTNLNRQEVFKAFHDTQPCSDPAIEHVFKYTSCAYYVVLKDNPAVSSIIRTAAHQRFLLRTLLQYARVTSTLAQDTTYSKSRSLGTLSPVFCICNHSCDPNAVTMIESGRTKLVVLRPVRKGEQIFTSYGPTWWQPRPNHILGFPCRCIVCEPGTAGAEWRRKIVQQLPPKIGKNLHTLHDVTTRVDINVASKLNALQQFLKLYADRYHPQKELGMLLMAYRHMQASAICDGSVALARARLQTIYVDN